MNRVQRRRHALLWALLAPVLVAAAALAIAARPQAQRPPSAGATP